MYRKGRHLFPKRLAAFPKKVGIFSPTGRHPLPNGCLPVGGYCATGKKYIARNGGLSWLKAEGAVVSGCLTNRVAALYFICTFVVLFRRLVHFFIATRSEKNLSEVKGQIIFCRSVLLLCLSSSVAGEKKDL